MCPYMYTWVLSDIAISFYLDAMYTFVIIIQWFFMKTMNNQTMTSCIFLFCHSNNIVEILWIEFFKNECSQLQYRREADLLCFCIWDEFIWNFGLSSVDIYRIVKSTQILMFDQPGKVTSSSLNWHLINVFIVRSFAPFI